MNIALWIVAGLAAAAFLMAGAMTLMQGKKVEEKVAWARHSSDAGIRGIGAVEVAGALGLILPAVTGIAVWLVPTAAICLVIVMAGAVRRHIADREPAQAYMAPTVLAVLALIVAVGRIGVAPF